MKKTYKKIIVKFLEEITDCIDGIIDIINESLDDEKEFDADGFIEKVKELDRKISADTTTNASSIPLPKAPDNIQELLKGTVKPTILSDAYKSYGSMIHVDSSIPDYIKNMGK